MAKKERFRFYANVNLVPVPKLSDETSWVLHEMAYAFLKASVDGYMEFCNLLFQQAGLIKSGLLLGKKPDIISVCIQFVNRIYGLSDDVKRKIIKEFTFADTSDWYAERVWLLANDARSQGINETPTIFVDGERAAQHTNQKMRLWTDIVSEKIAQKQRRNRESQVGQYVEPAPLPRILS